MRLTGSVVIVDEAHNLVSAVNAAHAAVVSIRQLQAARAQLAAYHRRFQSRLAPGKAYLLRMRFYCPGGASSFLLHDWPFASSCSTLGVLHDHPYQLLSFL